MKYRNAFPSLTFFTEKLSSLKTQKEVLGQDYSLKPEPQEAAACKIKLIHGGREYFDLLVKLLANAKDSVYLQTYVFEEDQTGNEVAAALIEAAKRNVNVFVLVDGFASGKLSDSFIERLESAGVHFRMFDPIFKSKHFYVGRRLHHKVVVIDGMFALVGGINISDRYNDLPGQPAWLDWAVYVEGAAVTRLAQICQDRVNPPTIKSLIRSKKNIAPCPIVTVNINDWVRGKKEITRSYLMMFRQAKKDIIIMSAYFLPNGQFRKSLKQAATRGVKIQLILAGSSDVMLAKYAERYMYRWLLRNGIEIYEYQKSILHGKMAVYDQQWSTVGSYNVNSISAYASIELNLAIDDVTFAQQTDAALKRIIFMDCLPIMKEQLQHAGLITRMMQQGAYFIFRVLFFLFTFYFKQRQ